MKTLYTVTARIFKKLKLSKVDGTYLKELEKLTKMEMLILDDFGLQQLFLYLKTRTDASPKIGRVVARFDRNHWHHCSEIPNMSLVGPRPLLVEYLPLYNEIQKRRHEAKPGITGWAQVNGRNAISWDQKFAYDVWYVDNISLALDIKILLMTVLKVFKSEGISQDGQATMTKFEGNK